MHFPSGRSATELVANDAAHLVWAVNLGVIDFNPWPARRADLDHPDELRVDLDPTPEVGFDDVRQVALCVREVLADHGPARLSRRPRARAVSTSTSGSSRLGLHRGPPRGAGAGARGRAARAEAGDLEVVEGGAPRRLRRLQPERPRPHRRLGLLGPPHRPTPASRPRSTGTRSPTSTRPSCASTPCPRGSPSAATRRRRSTTSALARVAARARRPRRGRGPRRRPLAPPLPQADGRAEARAAEPGEEELS